MLGLDNPVHILFLLAVLLLVFGARRLPEMGRSLGEGLRGFKDSITAEPSKPELSSTTGGTEVTQESAHERTTA